MGTTKLITAEQLLRMPDTKYYELVAGKLRKISPHGLLLGFVLGNLCGLLRKHVDRKKGEALLLGHCGFVLARNPDTVLAPDMAFISAERVAAHPFNDDYWPGAPDLAVEIHSIPVPPAVVREKAHAWIYAGARLVWEIDPEARTVTVYRPATDIVTLGEDAELDAEPLIPGFHCPIADLFAE
jgi:Uma2 family endonuclease